MGTDRAPRTPPARGGGSVTSARIEVRGGLVALVRDATSRVPLPHRRSIKDAVESLGVPHTEVAVALVDGRPAHLDDHLEGGQVVVVHDVLDPPEALGCPAQPPVPADPRFVADVHLGTLARRLRLLGFDTWYATDAHDARLADVAVAENRILLSRDRGLLSRRAVRRGALVRPDQPDEQLDELVARFGLATRARPGTRCPRCNGPTQPVQRDDVRDHLEPGTLAAGYTDFRRCRDCRRVYWPGAHAHDLASIVDRAIGNRGPRPTD